MKLKLISYAIVLLILALGFNALLSLSSLEKLYVESIVSKYKVIGNDLKRNLEKSLKFGKNIRKFVNMQPLLLDTRKNIARKIDIKSTLSNVQLDPVPESDITVSVALPDGTILYSTGKKFVNKKLPTKVQHLIKSGTEGADNEENTLRYAKHGTEYVIPLSVFGGFKKTWMATVVISFDENQVKSLLKAVMIKNIITIVSILGCVIILLAVLLKLFKPEKQKKLPKLKISAVMFVVIALSQIIFSGINLYLFKAYYLHINMEKTAVLATILKEDIEYLLSKGIRIDKLVKMDVMMGEIINAAPELDNITITDDEGNPLYMATRTGVIDFQKLAKKKDDVIDGIKKDVDPNYNLKLKLIKDKKVEGFIAAEVYQGVISTNISKEVLYRKLKEVSLDSATVLVISILFFLELLIMAFQLIEKQFDRPGLPPRVNYLTMRPIAFMFFFGIDISISFLPLHMEKIYEPILGLPKSIVMGLPISMQMFFTAISLFISGAWCDKRGWHEPFLVGLVISGTGFIYSWLAPSALHFVFSFGMVGLGYGLSLMASQGFIISQTTSETKAKGLSQLYAGIYAGSICGGAAGGMLAERLGYGPVFCIGGSMLFFVACYTLFTMRHAFYKPKTVEAKSRKDKIKIGQIIGFLTNRSILSLILLSAVPAAIALVGFLNYLSPIYLKEIGTSQSNIGRILMIYGLCLIYISPIISKYVGAAKNKKIFIVISGLIACLAFVNFHFVKDFSGTFATALGVLFLGISFSFAASRNAYALNLKVSQELGEGKALGILYATARVGQVIGPVLFGWMFIMFGLEKSIVIAGGVYLIVTLIFLLFKEGKDTTPATTQGA